MVVSIDNLLCLDALVWFGTGDRAAAKLDLSQSTISRIAHRVAQTFGVNLLKDQYEWSVYGDDRLLNLERSVHQQFRWNRSDRLRLDAQYYSGPLFTKELTGQYLLGNFDFLNVDSPIGLLRSSVIDAWIGCHPDIPDDNDPDLLCFPLTRLPTYLVVSPAHPLLRIGNEIALSDISAFPCLALQDGAFPRVQSILESLGLWSNPVRISRYKVDKWEGKTQDQMTVGYATSFSMGLYPGEMVPLPISIPLEVGDTLVVKRVFADHPRLQTLLKLLQSRAIELASQYRDVSLAF